MGGLWLHLVWEHLMLVPGARLAPVMESLQHPHLHIPSMPPVWADSSMQVITLWLYTQIFQHIRNYTEPGFQARAMGREDCTSKSHTL